MKLELYGTLVVPSVGAFKLHKPASRKEPFVKTSTGDTYVYVSLNDGEPERLPVGYTDFGSPAVVINGQPVFLMQFK